MSTPTGSIANRRREMSELDCYAIERLFVKYGHGPILDLIAMIVEPHPAEDDAQSRSMRRAFADTLRGLAANLPDDIRY